MSYCDKITLPDGTVMLVRRSGHRKQPAPCQEAGCTKPHAALCDWPLATVPGATCDRELCAEHRVRVGRDRDFCPTHARWAEVPEPERAAANGVAAFFEWAATTT